MLNKFMRRSMIVVLALFLTGLFLVDSSAQRRRRKHRSRRPAAPRIVNPAIYQPGPGDEVNANTNSSSEGAATPANQNPDDMRQTIRSLSSQVDTLTNKINQMGESQRTLVDLERLSRAEQRSAALWAELRDVEAKQTELQTRSDEVTYALKPENIERAVAGYGSTKPEEVREERRRQLENEKTRIEKQLAQLAANHTRLEQAIASADAEAETLRKRLDAVDKAALENAKTKAQGEGAAPAATPSPSPNQ